MVWTVTFHDICHEKNDGWNLDGRWKLMYNNDMMLGSKGSLPPYDSRQFLTEGEYMEGKTICFYGIPAYGHTCSVGAVFMKDTHPHLSTHITLSLVQIKRHVRKYLCFFAHLPFTLAGEFTYPVAATTASGFWQGHGSSVALQIFSAKLELLRTQPSVHACVCACVQDLSLPGTCWFS